MAMTIELSGEAAKKVTDLSVSEGCCVTQAADFLLRQKVPKAKSGGATKVKAGRVPSDVMAYIKSYAEEKNVTVDEAVTLMVLAGVSRRRALVKDRNKRLAKRGPARPTKKKATKAPTKKKAAKSPTKKKAAKSPTKKKAAKSPAKKVLKKKAAKKRPTKR